MTKSKLEQNQHARPISLPAMTALTGFFGGIFWGLIGLLSYFFHFTEIGPNTVLEPWAVGDWKTSWLGTVISLTLIGLLGIVAAFIYYFTLKKFKSMWAGLLYGAILFALVFFVLNPLFPSLNPISELKRNTIISMVCLYLLFGVFVGYSISYEYNEQNARKNIEQIEEQEESK